MKKFAFLHSLAALGIFTAALVLFPGPAQAVNIITDFSDWTDMGLTLVDLTPGLFSQQTGGPLYFNDATGSQKDWLRAPEKADGSFFAAMQYSHFSSNNNNAAGQGLASIAALGLRADNVTVMVDEGQVTTGKFFQAMVKDNTTGVSTYLGTVGNVSADSGWLGIGYNGVPGAGGVATFWYGSGNGWTRIGTPYAPNFSGDLYGMILGKDGPNANLSFQVQQLQVFPNTQSPQSPVPLPPSFFLLGSGLLGLAGLRRFRRS